MVDSGILSTNAQIAIGVVVPAVGVVVAVVFGLRTWNQKGWIGLSAWLVHTINFNVQIAIERCSL